MKKIMLLTLALITALVLCACGSDDTNNSYAEQARRAREHLSLLEDDYEQANQNREDFNRAWDAYQRGLDALD